MTITRVDEFLAYFEKVHGRTAKLLPLIPDAQLEQVLVPNKFSFGDLLRHLAGTERYMFVANAIGEASSYPGHSRALADGYGEVMTYYHQCHAESVDLLRKLSDDDLQRKCQTPAGASITVWKWLRAMLEHEIHHRGQLYFMLGMVGVSTPPIFGLSSEEVRDLSRA